MTVRVRMFAALREAAGTGDDVVGPGPLADVIAELCRRHGGLFAERLAVSTVLVDGTAYPMDSTVAVADGAEIALLPPFSGGSAP